MAALLIFGLTLENYNIKMVATFYSLTVAAFLAVVFHMGPTTIKETEESELERI